MRAWLIGSVMLLAACGARSGLDSADPPTPPMPDGGDIQATLPCRWSVGVPVLVRQTDGAFGRLGGGTVGTRDSVLNRAVVGAVHDGESSLSWVGGVVTTAGVGELLVPIEETSLLDPLAGREGFVARDFVDCEIRAYDLDFGSPEITGRVADRAGGGCRTYQTRVDSLEVAEPAGDGGFIVRTIEGFESASTFRRRDLLRTEARSLVRIDVVHQPERGTLVLTEQADFLGVERHAGAVEVAEVGEKVAGALQSVAADRLRGGMIVLYESPTGWRLERVAFEGPLAARELLDLSELPAPPIGRVASNETEALVPLADGSMLYVILSSPRIRLVNMEDVPAVEAMEVVIRPDDSSGGLLYVPASSEGHELWFRPLTCNR